MGRTAPLTSKHCILYVYSTNVGYEYFKHVLYSPFFSLQNAVCFIMLTCLVPAKLTFYIQDVLKYKKIIPAAVESLASTTTVLLVERDVLGSLAPLRYLDNSFKCTLLYWLLATVNLSDKCN
jgi:hypothetical protein